jgi:hypothetical protein
MNYFDFVDTMYYRSGPVEGPFIWDPDKERLVHLNETTGSDAVSFIPAHLGVVKAKVADLAKKKKDWKIEILEQDDLREVSFEDSLHIVVPNEHWDSFCSIFDNSPTNNTYLNLTSLLNETMEEEMKDLRQELRVSLAHMYDSTDFQKLEESATSWKWRFGVSSYVTKRKRISAPVTYENRGKDIQKLYDRLIQVYGEDRGNLEMLVEAVRETTPLNTFKVFKGYDFLYATRIHSRYGGISLYFEATLDNTHQLSQTIYIPKADDLLDKIEEESVEVKRVRSVLYPKGGAFTSRFLRLLSDTIEGLDDETE